LTAGEDCVETGGTPEELSASVRTPTTKKVKKTTQKPPLPPTHYILTQYWISTELVFVSDARMTPEL
jgi:hypothetical protein